MSHRGQELRSGFSTGTAAAAATKGALLELIGIRCFHEVEITLPINGSINIPLYSHRLANGVGECTVIKDAGDDPDVTHRAEIGARVKWVTPSGGSEKLHIKGGEGVGRVTKPGLPVRVGGPAINPVPCRMIKEAVREVLKSAFRDFQDDLDVEIFVPRGEEIAKRTLNPRLGIIGGISILGTTGLVKPFSHAAYRATILSGIKVAKAMGLKEVVFSTGGKSERYAERELPSLKEEAFVQMGDYVQYSLRQAGRMGFEKVTVAVFFGKAVKIGQGLPNTHASRGSVDFKKLARWTLEESGDTGLAQSVADANTAREVLKHLKAANALRVLDPVGLMMLKALRKHAGPRPSLEVMLFDFSGPILWRSESDSH